MSIQNIRRSLRGSLVSRDAGFGITVSQLEPGKCIGRGTYGTVTRMTRPDTGQTVVVKEIQGRSGWTTEELRLEAELLQSLDHPHILRIFGWHEMKDESSNAKPGIKIIMEDCIGGDLLSVIKRARRKHERIQENWVATAFKQAFEALAYLHGRGIVHKDIKAANLLLLEITEVEGKILGKIPHIIVCDLGLAEVCPERSKWFPLGRTRCTEVAGTPSTMAPEVWRNDGGPKSDIWSMGVVMFEIFSSRTPFSVEAKNLSMEEQASIFLKRIAKGPNWHTMRVSQSGKLFGKRLMTVSEAERPTALACLKDPWILSYAVQSPYWVEFSFALEALSRWPKTKPLQRALCVKLGAESRRVNQFSRFFTMFDKKREGRVKEKQVRSTLRSLGFDKRSAKDIAACLDFNKDGYCEYLEFVAALLHTLGEQYDDMLGRLFLSLDTNKKGILSGNEMAPLILELISLSPGRNSAIVKESFGDLTFSEFAYYFGRPGLADSFIRTASKRFEVDDAIQSSEFDSMIVEMQSIMSRGDADFDSETDTETETETETETDSDVGSKASVSSFVQREHTRTSIVSLGEFTDTWTFGDPPRFVSL